jgi:hypothetical protein
MKKNLLILALIFALVIVSGCNKNEVDKPEINLGNNEKQEIADTLLENNQKETKDDNAEYVINYEDALAKVYAFINNIDDEVGPIDGFDGIWEATKALGDEALDEIGYVLKDISGDEVPELLIGAFEKDDDAYTNNEIYLIYTLQGEKTEIVLYGWNRNAYSLKDDNSLFYQGSSGAAMSAFGIYRILNDGESVCDDFYFTYPNEEDPSVIELFHNTTGIFYNEDGEKLDMTLDEFWELEEEMSKGTSKIEGKPFSKLDAKIIEKANEKPSVPGTDLLDGEWVLSGVEVEGEKLTAEEAGLESEITITSTTSDVAASYFNSTEYATERFEAEVIYMEEPLYYQCENDAWSVKFGIVSGDFGEDEEFYATLIDDNTLLLRHLFPFDGTQGVSHQTYKRK